MKNGLYLLGITACALVAGTIAYLYRTDSEVRGQVDDAVSSVRDLCSVVGERIQVSKVAKKQAYEDDVERNRAWADQQWEALGI